MTKFFHYFKKYDQFAVPISFRHKKEDTYTNWFGGFITLIIVGFALGFGIYYSIDFFKKNNYTVYYYTTNLNQTEEINLKKSKAAIAFGFECSKQKNNDIYGNLKITDLLYLKVKYVYYTNNGQNKNSTKIGTHNCIDSDFYNDKDIINSLEKNQLRNLICLDDLNKVIKNRYQDRHDNFTYFQIDIEAKSDTKISNVRNYILDNDCKIELYYIDIKIEIDNFEEPIKPFLNEIFLQLDPDLHLRMNTFFMNSYFGSNNDLIFPTKTGQKMINLFSRTEQYFLHRGENTGEESFAKIYIRADTRRMEVRRKYQTLFEFFADSFSLWEDLFLICNILFSAYNRICLIYSIEKRLFFFNKLENKNHNLSQNPEIIYSIIKSTDKYSEKYPKLKKKKINNSINVIKTNNISSDDNTLDHCLPLSEQNTNRKKKIFDIINNNIPIKNNKPDGQEVKKNNRQPYITINKNKCCCRNCKCTGRRFFIYLMNFVNYLNFCECKEHKCKKIDLHYYYGEDFINSKLDISHCLKNIILFDNIKNMMLEKEEIFKFLSLKFISPKKENGYYKYPKKYTKIDFESLETEISNLIKTPEVGKIDEYLLAKINRKLKEINDYL